MSIQSILLLINNNINSFISMPYIVELVKSIFFFISTFTIPCYVFEYTTSMSNNTTINTICYHIYKKIYYIPSFAVLYLIHNSRLVRLLQINNKVYNNPNHIYVTLLYCFIYFVCIIIANIGFYNYNILYIADTFSYSLFFNEIAYTFLDNELYNYNNKIDFYNTNVYIFLIYGFIISMILSDISYQWFLPVSFMITSLFQNCFIGLRYKKNPVNSGPFINFIYYLERTFNICIAFVSTFILYSLGTRKGTKV